MNMHHTKATLAPTNISTWITSMTPVPHEPKMVHGQPILKSPDLTPAERQYWENYNVTTYFTSELGNRTAFNYHVATILLITVIIYPICMILQNVGSKRYLWCLTFNLLLTLSSLLSIAIFHGSFKSYHIYASNIYGKLSWILFSLILVHYIVAVLMTLSGKRPTIINTRRQNDSNDHTFITPESDTQDIQLDDMSTLSPGTSITAEDSSNEIDLEQQQPSLVGKSENFRFNQDTVVYKWVRKLSPLGKLFFPWLNIMLFAFLLVYITMGLAIGNLFGKGVRIFNLLAHWIKGGVFFTLGIVALARYCGLGYNHGWAWNRIIVYSSSDGNDYRDTGLLSKILNPEGMITMEALESFLIFFYGITNVFLEHLAGAGGAWTPKDLQHVSIAFIYIGAGLCGLLVEVKLNQWRYKHTIANIEEDENHKVVVRASPGFSPNPFPALTIFWTGILMSQHAQISMTSTLIHTQWGYLLSYGSFFRLFTFLLLLFHPNKSAKPSYPFTELITSFCLICGGIVFMESTDQVVEALEYRGYTPMFTFNLSVGLTSLIMAWEMTLAMWHDWLTEQRHDNASSSYIEA
ncbi:hypothetical protein NCAS_0D04510 [Naumovozyma castellii]|uniref:Protein YTP1-like C-terminal domain-containing protein n=1 Tax=Naumovozyma castellii TaxID=27288 RepID=G0VEP1_NAUCA|nr:hypothetical protein NCAS_0D04510 [Naumovozyma castellii CBS 4309]CCC70032.1 hypothetical protein NCAS_0D04510 [Naumovozyma castellii CBS 4309]